MPNPMSDRQYVATKGLQCPVCRGTNTGGDDSPDIDGDGCSQEMSCAECGSEWREFHERIGYVLVTQGGGEPEVGHDEPDQ